MFPIKPKKSRPRKPSARELFIERAKREGRIEEYKRRYKENKANPLYNWREAAQKAMDDMGFVSVDLEREIHERFMRFGNAGIPEQLVAAQEQIQQGELINTLGEFDINESELPVDIAFVFHNLHKAVGEQSQWKVTPGEAPSPGAWNMLIWASENQTKFFDKVLGDKLKQGTKGEEQGMRDTGESIEQIEQMLGQLSEVSNGKDVLQNGDVILHS
jgi:hypothetical protein